MSAAICLFETTTMQVGCYTFTTPDVVRIFLLVKYVSEMGLEPVEDEIMRCISFGLVRLVLLISLLRHRYAFQNFNSDCP